MTLKGEVIDIEVREYVKKDGTAGHGRNVYVIDRGAAPLRQILDVQVPESVLIEAGKVYNFGITEINPPFGGRPRLRCSVVAEVKASEVPHVVPQTSSEPQKVVDKAAGAR